MSKCVKNFNPSGKVFGINCDDESVSSGDTPNLYPNMRKDPCIKAPCGEPNLLTLLANAIYDESGINLCRTIDVTSASVVGPTVEWSDIEDHTCNVLLEVVDYDLASSTVELLSNRPNCVGVKLTDLEVTFAAKFLDTCGRILATTLFKATYLASDDSLDCYDPDTNPTSICTELYAPYGVTYGSDYEPVINGIGYIADSGIVGNNVIPQGISIQAMAKVLNFDFDTTAGIHPVLTVGLTLMLRSSYIVEYRFEHAGISVPPKAVPIIEEDLDCIRFVEGDLLAKNVRPLEHRKNVHYTDPQCPNPHRGHHSSCPCEENDSDYEVGVVGVETSKE